MEIHNEASLPSGLNSEKAMYLQVHDLPGFYPSVEPRHARPETLGPDAPSKGSRNPSFPFSANLHICGSKVTKIAYTVASKLFRQDVVVPVLFPQS